MLRTPADYQAALEAIRAHETSRLAADPLRWSDELRRLQHAADLIAVELLERLAVIADRKAAQR